MWQERESCAARSPGSLWRRAKTRLATRRPSPSPASVQGTNDRPGGGTGVQKGPEGLGEPLRQVLPAAPCSQTASWTTCQPAGWWDSPRPVPGSSTGPARHTGQARPSRLLAPRPGTRGPQNQQHRARQCGLFISNRVCTRRGLPSLLRGHPRVEDSGLQRSDSLPHAARRRHPWLGLTRGRPVPHPRCSLRAPVLVAGLCESRTLGRPPSARAPRGSGTCAA